MPKTRQVSVNGGDVLLLVGTVKGAFLLRSNRSRARWELGGPHFPGTVVYSLAYDDRGGRQQLWAGTQSFRWGALARSSDDFGETWTEPETYSIKVPAESGVAHNF